MTDLERRHRKATDKISRWCAAANNARAMGDGAVRIDGAGLALVAERTWDLARMIGVAKAAKTEGHSVAACRCILCVLAWEQAAETVELRARNEGVDPKRHSFGALQRMAGERTA